MNVAGNENQTHKSNKHKKIIIWTIAITILLLIGIIALIAYESYLNANAFKVIIDGKMIGKLPENTFIVNGNDVKVQIKSIAPYLGGYSYKNGQYGRSSQYTEDRTSCYLQSDNEVASYSQNSQVIEKIVLNEGTSSETATYQEKNLRYEEYNIETPVEMINNNLYTDLTGINIGCNVQSSYNIETNTLTIYTLDYLASVYSNKIQQAAVYGEDVPFSNKKAILYGWVVVKDDKENYGVNTINNQTIIGQKYKSIKFIESAREFIVETTDSKMGIILISNGDESKTKISPSYDNITEIDDELYLVSNNEKYGIINKNNQTIVNVEYDEIGIGLNQLAKYDIKNGYVLYEDCIPVRKDKFWGFISKSSRSFIIEPTYDDIGCIIGTSTENAASSVMLVPEYEGIIVKKGGKYGLINSVGKVIIQPEATEFYSTNNGQQMNYFFIYNGERINLIDFLKKNNIMPISDITNQGQVSESENVQTN